MLIAGAMQAILDAFGSLTFFIDKGVYFFAKAIYDVFMFIADARLLDNGIAMNLTRRIYAILSIFMLFVLGYNLLLYIIDPDKMTDKEKGMGAIIKNVVIALVVIILLPTLFNRLYSLQSMVLKSGVIENLFLGGYTEVSSDELGNTSNPSASSGIEKGVNIMIANTYAAFLLPEDENNFTVLQCDDGESENTYTEYCEAWKNVKETGNIAYFSTFVGNDDYRFYPFISTVVGIVLIFFMLSFCINLATRAAKMAILQLIAPIPLVLEILPNKKGVRQGWVKELISVYLQVFIYMAMIFLVIFLISMVPNIIHKIAATNFKDIAKSAGTFTMLVAVLIISYGLLLFGKEAPGYVLKLMGIESTGVLKAAGLRAFRMAKATTLAAGEGKAAIGRMSRNFADTYRQQRLLNQKDGVRFPTAGALGSGVLSAVGGGVSGAGRTIWGLRNVKSAKDFKNLQKNVNETVTAKRMERDAYAHERASDVPRSVFDWQRKVSVLGSHIGDTVKTAASNVNAWSGHQTEYEKYKEIEDINKKIKSAWKDKVASIWESDGTYQTWKRLKEEADSSETGEINYGGRTYTSEQLKENMNRRKTEIIKNRKQDVMAGLESVNNVIDTYQGIPGIISKRADIGEVARSTDGGLAYLDKFEKDIKDPLATVPYTGISEDEREGYDFQLKRVGANDDYLVRKIKERNIKERELTQKEAIDKKNSQANGDKK